MNKCKIEDCGKTSETFFHVDHAEHLYCPQHAWDHGFCSNCKYFVEHNENRYFVGSGMCEGCYDERKSEDWFEHEYELVGQREAAENNQKWWEEEVMRLKEKLKEHYAVQPIG